MHVNRFQITWLLLFDGEILSTPTITSIPLSSSRVRKILNACFVQKILWTTNLVNGDRKQEWLEATKGHSSLKAVIAWWSTMPIFDHLRITGTVVVKTAAVTTGTNSTGAVTSIKIKEGRCLADYTITEVGVAFQVVTVAVAILRG